MDPRLQAILELRLLSERFAADELPFEKFLPTLNWHSFDDEDDAGRWEPRKVVEDLPEELQTEYLFYVKWRIAAVTAFRDPSWVYGRSAEPYGWIDKDKYRREFAEEFHRLRRIGIAADK